MQMVDKFDLEVKVPQKQANVFEQSGKDLDSRLAEQHVL